MSKKLFLGAVALAFAGLLISEAPARAEDMCYSRDSAGKCLDDNTLPTTGQYTNADSIPGKVTPGNLKATQAHGTVRLTEATFIFAHNICRWVDNSASHGKAVFIGLEAKSEWTSFISQPPSGASLQYCCQPATVSICGAAKALPFAVSGKAYTFTGGYNYKATYTCGTGIAGAAPTQDTSWSVAASGQCAAPAPVDTCDRNLHVSADCQTPEDTTPIPDHGTRGNHAGSNGDGPGNSGGHSDGPGG